MEKYSFLNALHPKLIEELYQKYIHFPYSIEPSWRAFFQGFDLVSECKSISDNVHVPENNNILKEFQVISLIEAYRSIGHIFSITNPINPIRSRHPIDIEEFGLSSVDLYTVFQAAKLLSKGKGPSTLSTILDSLKATYCESIGIEYMHLSNPERIACIQNSINNNFISIEYKKKILKKLNEAIVFESYLHTKFAGKKRFSIEGNETLLPALDELLEYASVNYEVEELVVGMAHRGRLNVLANIFKKDISEILSEFNSKEYEEMVFAVAGDVKYHLGATTIRKNSKGKIVRMILAPNPSHLESVDPVVEGIARANIDHRYRGNDKKLLPILIHGDAAIAGQGIIYEIVQMSQLSGYTTGGTIHIVVNNQIGFTTNYIDGRSSTYCTDVAKVILSPVLHVNADDVEAVVHAIRIAVDFRMHFKQDVFIDLLGYRKYGHNEGDEPSFTQPTLYKSIANHPNARDIYQKKLDNEHTNVFQEEYFRKKLDLAYEISHSRECNKLDYFLPYEWNNFHRLEPGILFQRIDTSFPIDKLHEIGKKITFFPKELTLYTKTKKLFKKRKEMINKGQSIDWGMAELLAYGSLLYEGFEVRLSGEDVERGTFSHRHAVVTVVKTEDKEEKYIPLNHINRKQAHIAIYNSPLSEYGVMGFDYGYAMASPNTLTIWESQFGDFSNGAQIIIDQYISAAEDKWKMQNGLVIFLPHGYEGQGPEHSSARIERYLQLCGRYNMCLLNCTHPANFFHALRRQIKWSFRKPLIVFTPKSLLRHTFCVCSLEDLAIGCFQPIIDDHKASSKKVTKLVFCSGKIYYELFERRENIKAHHIALIRLEQLYPINTKSIENILIKYDTYEKLLWVQEEPENMGAWPHISRTKFAFELIARLESASPSSGSYKNFIRTQEEILDRVFK